MTAGPYFDSGGFRRDQVNSVGVHLVDVNGNPYTAGGGAGASTVDSQLQFKEAAAFVYAPGTAARGLLVDPISGSTDGAVGLPGRIGVVAGYDGTNVRALKTSAAGVTQVDVLSQPAGGATAANQATELTRLTEIRDRLPDLTATAAPAATDEGIVVHVATQPAGGGGGSANTEYIEGATDATIAGIAAMWEDTGDTLRAVSAAKPLPVAQQGNVNIGNFPAAQPVTDNGGSLTVDGTVSLSGAVDTELTTADLDTGAGTDTRAVIGLVRAESGGGLLVGSANPLPITGALTDTQLRASAVPVSGPLTDAQLRATAVPVGDGGASLTVDNATISVVGGGTEATAQRVTIANDSTGVLSVDDNGGSLTVDGSVSLAAAIPAGTNNIGDVDVLTLPALPAGTNNIGDVDVLTLPAISLAASANNIGDVDVLTLPGVAGTVAHDAADSGNPVKVGARALTGDITAVVANDRVDSIATILGKHVVMPYTLPGNLTKGTANSTGTSDTSVIAAPGAGIALYITHITITNAHATVGTKVQVKSGTTATGYPRVYAGAVGGGASMHFPAPLKLTANEALQFACVTTGADVDVSASGYTAAE